MCGIRRIEIQSNQINQKIQSDRFRSHKIYNLKACRFRYKSNTLKHWRLSSDAIMQIIYGNANSRLRWKGFVWIKTSSNHHVLLSFIGSSFFFLDTAASGKQDLFNNINVFMIIVQYKSFLFHVFIERAIVFS